MIDGWPWQSQTANASIAEGRNEVVASTNARLG